MVGLAHIGIRHIELAEVKNGVDFSERGQVLEDIDGLCMSPFVEVKEDRLAI